MVHGNVIHEGVVLAVSDGAACAYQTVFREREADDATVLERSKNLVSNPTAKISGSEQVLERLCRDAFTALAVFNVVQWGHVLRCVARSALRRFCCWSRETAIGPRGAY